MMSGLSKLFDTNAGEHEAVEVKRLNLLCVCAIQVQSIGTGTADKYS